MTESSTQPETNETAQTDNAGIGFVEQPAELTQQTANSSAASTTPPALVWTPRFMLLFALTLVVIMSVDSLLTQAVMSRFFSEAWVSLAHLLPAFACLLATIIITRSWWVRLGAIFASVWILFMGINHLLTLYTLDPNSTIPSLLNATFCGALLGAYVCLSIARTPVTRWDSWFFRFILIGSIFVVPLIYIATPAESRTLNTIESDLAALALTFSLLVWWARPSCWKIQPGLTLLFGIVPAIELLLAIPSVGRGGTNFYLTQVSLLCFLLATMRLLKGQLR
ncbi:MAG: hypothetical protein NVSMB27_24960 [Ktedonobacteraceae bacterium]